MENTRFFMLIFGLFCFKGLQMRYFSWVFTAFILLLSLNGCGSLLGKHALSGGGDLLRVAPVKGAVVSQPHLKKTTYTGVVAVAINSQTGQKFSVNSNVSAEDARIKAMRQCQKSTEKINACGLVMEKRRGDAKS
jgi:hypothetical protein